MIESLYTKGNIAFRPYNKTTFEIIKWVPNSYYGKESEYDKDGEWYRPKDNKANIKIHSNIFKYEKVCIVIATIDTKNEYLKGVGYRLAELTEKDYKDFKDVTNWAKDYIATLDSD